MHTIKTVILTTAMAAAIAVTAACGSNDDYAYYNEPFDPTPMPTSTPGPLNFGFISGGDGDGDAGSAGAGETSAAAEAATETPEPTKPPTPTPEPTPPFRAGWQRDTKYEAQIIGMMIREAVEEPKAEAARLYPQYLRGQPQLSLMFACAMDVPMLLLASTGDPLPETTGAYAIGVMDPVDKSWDPALTLREDLGKELLDPKMPDDRAGVYVGAPGAIRTAVYYMRVAAEGADAGQPQGILAAAVTDADGEFIAWSEFDPSGYQEVLGAVACLPGLPEPAP